MTENEYQDGNDLISIFLGGKLEGICPPFNAIVRMDGEIRIDWHWLMQPVLKILKCQYGDGTNLYFKSFEAINAAGQYIVKFNRRNSFECFTLAEALYLAVIDFIEWYNKNQIL